MEAYKKTQK